MLRVLKYGGSSLATPAHIRRAAAHIRAVKAAGYDVVVVVSAMGRMTDHLLSLARKTVSHPPQRELDMLLTAGERVSMALLAMALEHDGVPAISFTGSQTGIVTSSRHTDARIVAIRPVRVQEALARGRVVIIAGFQGVSAEKEITTLGRGGSDTTAVALAAALRAERCDIFTDVAGLYTADPRKVPSARLMAACPYEEALELASLGAKMQPRSLEVARRFGVVVRIASSAAVDDVEGRSGTWIGTRGFANGSASGQLEEVPMESTRIRGVATKDGFTRFAVAAPVDVVADALGALGVSLRFFSAAGDRMEFLADAENAAAVRRELERRGWSFDESAKLSVVSLVGDGITGAAEVVPGFLREVNSAGTRAVLVTANALSVTAAVPTAEVARIATALHRRFVEDAPSGPAESRVVEANA
jgi:aspartate kinase